MNTEKTSLGVKLLRALVRLFDEAVDIAVLAGLMALLLVGGYAL